MSLKIENLHVTREGKEIVKGIDLEIPAGEVHAIMGPNGSGKSSLANALMGHPKYVITAGRVLLDDEDVTNLKTNERAMKGLFLSQQHPPEVTGVNVAHFLRVITTTARREPVSIPEFRVILKEKMAELKMDPAFMHRSLNQGFSGGEKKRMEALQLALLEPKYAVLDETDSGLDIDALKIVTDAIAKVRGKDMGRTNESVTLRPPAVPRKASAAMGILLITHYARILKHLEPDRVHILADGVIARSGGKELADEVERDGYAFLNKN